MPKWTEDQKKAIERDGNILVSAASGSGKTAVLVERIIQKLIPDAQGNATGIQELLVVTFTNAAAAEMKEKIIRALALAMKKETDQGRKKYLKEQLSLAGGAEILTIDAFCRRVVQNHFHLLGIDPGFGIADQTEMELLKEEVLEDLFDTLYEAQDPDFLQLAQLYCSNRDDRALAQMILQIHSFISSLPDPKGWLEQKTQMFAGEFSQSVWERFALQQKREYGDKACGLLKEALEHMMEYSMSYIPQDWEAFLDNIPEDIAQALQQDWSYECPLWELAAEEYRLCHAAAQAGREDTIELLSQMTFLQCRKSLKRSAEWVGRWNEVQLLRQQARDLILEEVAPLFQESTSTMQHLFRQELYPVLFALEGLVLQFDEEFTKRKTLRNLLEFSDLEHLTLQLFLEQPDICESYREKYSEILMDEYQDTNGLQEAIFSCISKEKMFMVGDMKQSIYRFRGGDPTIFKEKSLRFQQGMPGEHRIVLSRNFRSREEVLQSVNDLFGCVMSEEVGELEYSEDQWLYPGDLTYESRNTVCHGYQSEFYLLETQPEEKEEIDEDLDKTRLEARFVAEKIREMIQSGYRVRDVETGQYRRMQCRDVVILSSSVKSVSAVYTEELKRSGMDAFAEISDYFEQSEIQLMLSLIKIIHNPLQDIPLLGVLRSPVCRLTEDQLARIRLLSDGSFYDALCRMAELEPAGTDPTPELCAAFLERLGRWREDSRDMPVDKLIWTLYEETDFYNFIGALRGGEQAQANLRLLFERAKQYESSGYQGLFNFIRYIGRLQRQNSDLAGAKLVGKHHDVVRIMTIHKSKGLEFPVVFLVGASKRFGSGPSGQRMLLHKDWGFGLQYMNREESYVMDTLSTQFIRTMQRREELSEEMRKLYVGLTRAKEKLIVTASVRLGKAEEKKESWQQQVQGGKLQKEAARSATGFWDWIGPAAWSHPESWHIEVLPYQNAANTQLTQEEEAVSEETYKLTAPLIDQILGYQYPYRQCSMLPSKISVTDLKRIELASEQERAMSAYGAEPLIPKPAFLQEEQRPRGAQLGTAYHTVMAQVCMKEEMTAQYIEGEIRRIVEAGMLTEAEAAAVDAGRIACFFASELGKRMLSAPQVYRECPFEIEIPASASHPELTGAAGESVILQGVIDCCFVEQGGIVLIDYKTDQGKPPGRILEDYSAQLQWYQKAIEQITKKTVKESYLYLFSVNDVVQYV